MPPWLMGRASYDSRFSILDPQQLLQQADPCTANAIYACPVFEQGQSSSPFMYM